MRRAFLIAVFAAATSAAQAQTISGTNPFANNPGAIEEGRGLYNGTCTGCHGANGAAGEIGPGLALPGRSYARTPRTPCTRHR